MSKFNRVAVKPTSVMFNFGGDKSPVKFTATVAGKEFNVTTHVDMYNHIQPNKFEDESDELNEAIKKAFNEVCMLRRYASKKVEVDGKMWFTPYYSCVVDFDKYCETVIVKVGSLLVKIESIDPFIVERKWSYKTFSNITADWKDFKSTSMYNDKKLNADIAKQVDFAIDKEERNRGYKVIGFQSFGEMKRYRQSTGQWDKR